MSPPLAMSKWLFILLVLQLKTTMIETVVGFSDGNIERRSSIRILPAVFGEQSITYVSLCVRNQQFGFPTRSDTNQAVQSQKQARSLKFGPLLDGAEMIYDKGFYRLFSKPGGLAQARHDLYQLKLENVRKSENGLEATVEDKLVIFRPGSSRYGDGVIDIWSLRKGTTDPLRIDRIRYNLRERSLPGKSRNQFDNQ